MKAYLSGDFRSLQRGVFVSSTGTEQGKTVLASGIAAWWHRESAQLPEVWKPVQSGAQWGDAAADSYRLKWGGGLTHKEEQELVTLSFCAPLSPLAAAEREGIELDFASLIAEGASRLSDTTPLIVEGAGGVAVPFTKEHTMTDLAIALQLPMLIVANPLLGTISHTVTAVEYVRSRGLADVAVIMGGLSPERGDREQECHDNVRIISDMASVAVLGRMPWLPHPECHDARSWEKWRVQWLALMGEQQPLCDWLRQRMA